jgi:hypothetical protein
MFKNVTLKTSRLDSYFGHVDIQGSMIFPRDFRVTINGVWIGNRIY